MLKFIIKKFFHILKKPKSYLTPKKLSSFIINPSLINEIILMKEFKEQWRNTLNYSLVNEKYKINAIKINKEVNGIKVHVNVLHSFKLNNNSYDKFSKEILKYIFFIKRINYKYMIVDMYNEENHPNLYKKVINDDFKFFDEKNKTISTLRDNIKLQYWQDKFKNIDEMVYSFKENIIKPYYRNKENKYDRHKAVAYARKYALNYNPEYKDFNNSGGDCTNYISQCLYAGGINQSRNWKPYSDNWIRVNGLYNYLTRNGYAQNINIKEEYLPGDIIQFYSNSKGIYGHSGIITLPLLNGDYLYCCHSYDKLDFPLSEIYPILYNKFRVLKIIY